MVLKGHPQNQKEKQAAAGSQIVEVELHFAMVQTI